MPNYLVRILKKDYGFIAIEADSPEQAEKIAKKPEQARKIYWADEEIEVTDIIKTI